MSDSYLPMASRLKNIREDLAEFAAMISKMVDTDVLIVDSNLDVVADALVYYELYNEVDTHSLISRVMQEKGTVIVQERRDDADCLNCPVHDTCEIQSLIGVPITYAGRIVGAIALLLPKHRSAALFSNLDLVIKFTENMAEQITGKLKARNDYNRIRLSELEKDTVLDMLDEGIAETDLEGKILYANLRFRRIFHLADAPVSQLLPVLLPNRHIVALYEGKPFPGERVLTIRKAGQEFNVIVSCREIRSVSQPYKRFLLTFRPSQEVWLSARRASFGSLMTMQWCTRWLFTPADADRAKSLAVSGKPVLIVGDDADLNDSAAKAICNYSDRGEQGIVSVNCNNISHELFDRYVLGRYGQIARADKATIIFYNAERLPLYLQEALTGYLKNGTVYHGNDRVQSDARVIFTTSADLEKEVSQGHFSEELYYRLKPNCLRVGSPLTDPLRLESFLESSLLHYREVLHKPSLALSRHAKQYLLSYGWSRLRDLEQFLESAARTYDGYIHQADLEALGRGPAAASAGTTLEEVQRAEIAKLLASGRRKTEIAQILGIGRATLYRKIREYGLDE